MTAPKQMPLIFPHRRSAKVDPSRKLRECALPKDALYWIQRGADVNAKDSEGRTALMIAIMINKQELVKFLIAEGADVNAKDNEGLTPIMFVRNADMAQILIDAGADVNAKDQHGLGIKERCQYSADKASLYRYSDDAKEVLAVVKRAQYDKEGLKCENTLARLRFKAAKMVDNKLGTHLSSIEVPEWARKAEARLAQKVDNRNSKKLNNERENAPLLAQNKKKALSKTNQGR